VLHTGTVSVEDIEDHNGYRVTTPLRSILDVAAGRLDLGLLTGAIRDAFEAGVTTRAALLRRASEFGPEAALRIERALSALVA
jgi:hypothetical protein